MTSRDLSFDTKFGRLKSRDTTPLNKFLGKLDENAQLPTHLIKSMQQYVRTRTYIFSSKI